MIDTLNSKNPIIVLSYNISFEAMTHNSHGSAGALGRKCTYIGNTKLTICGENMANMIDDIPVSVGVSSIDFVGLQEASRWYLLKSAAKNTLAKMEVVNTKSGRSEMASFYNEDRYILVKENNGEFIRDRPFQILVLKEKTGDDGVIFINSHNPHGYTFNSVQHHLSKSISALYLTDEEKEYQIIIVGDFNETGWDWHTSDLEPKEWKPFQDAGINKDVAIKNVIFSCCQADGIWNNGQGGIRKGSRGGDYIFNSTSPSTISVPKCYDVDKLQSDHLPIIAVL